MPVTKGPFARAGERAFGVDDESEIAPGGSAAFDAVVFDVGNVLLPWNPRALYAGMVGTVPIEDEAALDTFLRDVLTEEWHFQHDAGRPFAETSAELIARHPAHRALIEMWGPRFGETLGDPVPGMQRIVDDLAAADVALFAITNFSHEFFGPVRAAHPRLFGPFADVVVSGEERLVKPDPAIYRLAERRFGLPASRMMFVDDRAENIAAAEATGMTGHLFRDAPALRRDLVAAGLLSSADAA